MAPFKRRPVFRFNTPSSMMVVGHSGCGKTVLTTKLAVDNPGLFETPPKKIYYCYGSWEDGFKCMKQHGIKFHKGIPDLELLPVWFPKGGLLVLADLMEEGGNDKRILDLFTICSPNIHHQNITVIYLCQDMFPPGKFAKSISRNSHYIMGFKNPRDQLGMRNLLLQAFPTRWQEVQDTFPKSDGTTFQLHGIGFTPQEQRRPTHSESLTKGRRMHTMSSVEAGCFRVK